MSRSTPQAVGFPVGTANVLVAAPTTVEYALLPDELAESFAYQAAHNAGLRKVLRQNRVRANLVLLTFMVVPACLAVALEMGMDDSGWSLLRAACIAAGFWSLAVALSYLSNRSRRPGYVEAQRRTFRRLAREESYAQLLGPYRLELTPQGVNQAGPNREVRVRWAGVNAIVAEPAVTYFDLGAWEQMVVPIRAFSDDASHWAFVRLAREYKAAAYATDGDS